METTLFQIRNTPKKCGIALGAGGPCGDGRAMRLAKGEAFGWSAPIPCPVWSKKKHHFTIKKNIRHRQIKWISTYGPLWLLSFPSSFSWESQNQTKPSQWLVSVQCPAGPSCIMGSPFIAGSPRADNGLGQPNHGRIISSRSYQSMRVCQVGKNEKVIAHSNHFS